MLGTATVNNTSTSSSTVPPTTAETTTLENTTEELEGSGEGVEEEEGELTEVCTHL